MTSLTKCWRQTSESRTFQKSLEMLTYAHSNDSLTSITSSSVLLSPNCIKKWTSRQEISSVIKRTIIVLIPTFNSHNLRAVNNFIYQGTRTITNINDSFEGLRGSLFPLSKQGTKFKLDKPLLIPVLENISEAQTIPLSTVKTIDNRTMSFTRYHRDIVFC